MDSETIWNVLMRSARSTDAEETQALGVLVRYCVDPFWPEAVNPQAGMEAWEEVFA